MKLEYPCVPSDKQAACDSVSELQNTQTAAPTKACCAVLTQPCPTLCSPMDCSPPGSSLHGDSPGKNTGVGSHFFLQGIFPTQGLSAGLSHCRWILYCLSPRGAQEDEWGAYPFSRGSPPPEIEQESPALQADSLPAELPGKPPT